MDNQNQVKFYEREWFIALALFTFFPVGLFLMWKNKKWSQRTRVILTIVATLFFFFVLGSNDDGQSNDGEQLVSANITEENSTQKEDENLESPEENTENEAEEEKEEIEAKLKEDEITAENDDENQSKTNASENNQMPEKKDEETKKSEKLGDLKAHFIDVDQAESILFQHQGNGETIHILYDTGDWRRKDVVNYLNQLGVRTIDLVIISHPHADHIGQLEHVMKQFDVKEVWMTGNVASSKVYQRALEAVLNSNADFYEPKVGETFKIGPIALEVLHPNRLTNDLNRDSLSARLTYGNVSFLLTGDATKESEQEMMRRGNVRAHILSVGHHGSNTSTSHAFLDAVKPEVAIYSAGVDSQYGHPHWEVVQRIQERNISLYGTDVHGTIVVQTDGNRYSISTAKKGEIQAKGSPNNTQQTSKSNESKNNPTTPEQSEANQSFSTNKEEQENKNSSTNENKGSHCIDINKASFEQLQEIKHIGEDRAKQILELRPFNSVDQLIRVKGIGDARLADIKKEGKACVN